MVGDIKVLGKAPYEVADLLAEELKEYIRGPQVWVDVVEYKSQKVIIMGAVNSPGIYYIDTDRLSVLEVAMIAGGFTVDAKLDRIQIARGDLNNPQVLKVNIHRAVLKGEKVRDIALQSGDIVYVPKTVWGNINLALTQIMPFLESYLYTKGIIENND